MLEEDEEGWLAPVAGTPYWRTCLLLFKVGGLEGQLDGQAKGRARLREWTCAAAVAVALPHVPC